MYLANVSYNINSICKALDSQLRNHKIEQTVANSRTIINQILHLTTNYWLMLYLRVNGPIILFVISFIASILFRGRNPSVNASQLMIIIDQFYH